MCIVAIAWQLFDEMPLVLLSNRDEFLQRPTTAVHQWQDQPIYGGRDHKSGGTWLGLHQQRLQLSLDDQGQNLKDDLKEEATQNGRWAAVLNFRDGVQAAVDQRSRGELVSQFLTSDLSPLQYARQLDLQAYAGFNLIVGNAEQAVIVNNRGFAPTPLHSGLHIISNGQPDAEWFKCERLRMRIRQEVLPLISDSFTFHDGNASEWQAAAWAVLKDKQQAPDDFLPDTGMPFELEHALSSICIDTPKLPNYGTRTQSILTLRRSSHELATSKASRPPIQLELLSQEYQRTS